MNDTSTRAHIRIPTRISELPRHPNAGFDKFVTAVGSGDLEAGAVLTQAQLCDILGISLSPLRETLVLLEEYGLVEVKHRAGIMICSPELSFIRENYQFRILIETEALKLFTPAPPPGWVDAIRARHVELLDMIKNGKDDASSMEAFVALDHFMHESIVMAMNNKSIQSTHNRLQQNIRMLRAVYTTGGYRQNLLNAGNEHLELLDRIEAGDIEGATNCLQRHFEASIFRTLVNA